MIGSCVCDKCISSVMNKFQFLGIDWRRVRPFYVSLDHTHFAIEQQPLMFDNRKSLVFNERHPIELICVHCARERDFMQLNNTNISKQQYAWSSAAERVHKQNGTWCFFFSVHPTSLGSAHVVTHIYIICRSSLFAGHDNKHLER